MTDTFDSLLGFAIRLLGPVDCIPVAQVKLYMMEACVTVWYDDGDDALLDGASTYTQVST